jgi:hypothetical protein
MERSKLDESVASHDDLLCLGRSVAARRPPRPDDEARMAEMKVVVVGQGYVGLPLVLRAVDVGNTVGGLENR